MAETPAEATETSAATPAIPTEALAAATAEPTMAEEIVQREALGIRELVEAGCHFGHQTRRWNPRMKRFLFGERDGVHIIDLDQTLPRFEEALDFLRETTAAGGKVLFVSTKRQAQEIVETEAKRSRQYYVNRRWLGGMLTNFKTVKKSIDRYKELLELVADEEQVGELSKKELSRINRQIEKYSKSLDGMKQMTRLPDALFVIDVNRESIGVVEASRLGIPIIAIVDSNCNPDGIDLVVPGNDDSLRAIQLYCERAADACHEGGEIHNARLQSQVSPEDVAKAGEKPGTGRVVVEIQQPEPRQRRSRGDRDERRSKEAPKPEGPRNPRGEGGRDGVLAAAAEAAAPEEAASAEEAPEAAAAEEAAPEAPAEVSAEAPAEASEETPKQDGE
jgi:small subunit ribosomal protein S2